MFFLFFTETVTRNFFFFQLTFSGFFFGEFFQVGKTRDLTPTDALEGLLQGHATWVMQNKTFQHSGGDSDYRKHR